MSIKTRFISLSLSFLSLIQAQNIFAEEAEKSWRVDTSIGVFSDYMFRGTNLYSGSSIQPSVTGTYNLGFGEISGNLWMHLSGEGGGAGKPEPYTELDETLRYTYSAEDYVFSTGFAWYTYPDSSDNIHSTNEVFVSFAVNTLLTPRLTAFHDYDEYDAQYYELGLSHKFEKILADASLTPYTGFGFASNAEKLYAEDGLVQVTVGTSLSIPLENFSIVPNINYTFESDSAAVNQLWFGTSLNYSF
jgi:Bacterial protein of unknown function (Gcw_chp)